VIPQDGHSSKGERERQMNKDNSSVGLLTTGQAAVILGIAMRTLEGWRRQNVGPGFVRMSSRCVRYPRDQLEHWAASKFHQPPNPREKPHHGGNRGRA